MRKKLAIFAAVIVCPCHYPVWLALLGGTALGAALAQYAVPILLMGGLCFLLFLWLAVTDAARR